MPDWFNNLGWDIKLVLVMIPIGIFGAFLANLG